MTEAAQLLKRLEVFCRRHFDAAELVVAELTPIPEGHSGFTYFVDFADTTLGRMVLRLPPPGAQPTGPADVARQGRIMAALYEQGLPVPAVPAICEDPGVLDGRPFILMQAVDGVRADVAAQRWDELELAQSVIATMKQVHEADVRSTGLGGDVPTSLPGELARWTKLIDRAPAELVERAPAAAALLRASMPEASPPGLVHGDFTYGNLLFHGGRVVAVLDWEIAQLGEPLLDLGSLAVIAKRHEFAKDPNPSGAIRVSVDWLLREYGTQRTRAEWFVALSYYKYAGIVGYNTMLHRRGKRPDPIYDLMPETVVGLLDGVVEILS